MQVLIWVAVLSLLCAAASMGVIAWRTARGARDRESARIELLKTMALVGVSGVPAASQPISSRMTEFLSEQATTPVVDAYEPDTLIFGERGTPLTTVPRWISLAAVAAAMVLGGVLYAVLAGGPEDASVRTPAARATAAVAAPARTDARAATVRDRPIEVIDLQYQFGPANAFSVSGRVRNPADGRALPAVMAVVDLLDAEGRILTSQMTPLERPVFEAGQTSAFSLVFPHVTGTVARYQVGFRLQGRDTIPQVDRRAPEPDAKSSSS